MKFQIQHARRRLVVSCRSRAHLVVRLSRARQEACPHRAPTHTVAPRATMVAASSAARRRLSRHAGRSNFALFALDQQWCCAANRRARRRSNAAIERGDRARRANEGAGVRRAARGAETRARGERREARATRESHGPRDACAGATREDRARAVCRPFACSDATGCCRAMICRCPWRD